MTSTAALALKTALYTAAQGLYDQNVAVMFGLGVEGRDRNQAVAFLDVESRQETGPLSSTNRSRNEDIDLTVVISVATAGDTDDLSTATIAYGLLDTLAEHVRKTDPTVGGTCLWCFLTAHRSYGYTPADQLATGRLIEIEATFTARVRITG